MIGATMEFIVKRLNDHMRRSIPAATEELLVLSPVVSSDRSVPQRAENKLALTLINLQQDRAMTSIARHVAQPGGDEIAQMNPPLALNLEVMVSANFADERYGEALALLSTAINYFHHNASFDRQSAPDLPHGVDRLTIEWIDHNLVDTHNLWTSLGGHYSPSALYKIRGVIFEDNMVQADIPRITAVDLE